MSSILETLLGQLQGPALQQMASQVGADESTVRKAAATAIPVLLGAMARNAASDEGAQALHGAIQKDHDGSLLDNVQAFLGGNAGGRAANGAGILGHLLGSRAPAAATAVGQGSGLDASQAGRLMAMLAPLVMGAVGKVQRTQGLDPASLGASLQTEREQAVKGSGAGALLMSLLDRDGDGSVLDEAGGLLKGFLRGR